MSPRRKRRPATVRGVALVPPPAVGLRYKRDVDKIMAAVIKATQNGVATIFRKTEAREFFAEDAGITETANQALDKMFARLERMAENEARKASERMVEGVNRASRTGMAASLKELSGGVTLSPTDLGAELVVKMGAAIESNVSLITTMVESYTGKIADAVNRSIMIGNGLQDLVPFMQSQKGITMRHGKNVALDQTRKAYSGLNAARMESVGMSKFEWLHSGGGQAPRKYHMDRWPAGLNGGIFDLNDPPIIDQKTGERGIPAQAINCKCRMIPVLVMDEGNA